MNPWSIKKYLVLLLAIFLGSPAKATTFYRAIPADEQIFSWQDLQLTTRADRECRKTTLSSHS